MRLVAIAVVVLSVVNSPAFAETANWPQYRGARSDGLARGETLPDTWSTTENVVWKADIPGWGWSSPVIWGDKIFVTSAVSENELDRPVVGGYPGGRVQPDDVHRWMTYCLDFDSGSIIWEREAHKGVPPQQRHPRNSFASETPITDGERVYAYFANIGLFCYDMDGKLLWEQRWESYPMRGGWGTGASPVLHKDRIYVVNDNERESFMVALDKTTGRQIWRIAREEKSNWSTPYIWQHEDRTEIVTIGTGKVRSNDLDGKLLWELNGTSGLVSLMPLSRHGLLYLGAGYHYGPLYAIRPGASGDISLDDGESRNEWIAWSQPRGAGIHPGFLISGERLFVLFDAGLLTCFNARTGETIFPRQRLNTGGGRFYASPWAYNGNIFLLNEDGTTWVVEDGPQYNLRHKNILEDNAWATPAVARGSLFLRTYTGLYRLQKIEQTDRAIQDRAQRGTLHDALQVVRGDSGKWSDEPRLQHAPSIEQRPANMLLDEWSDRLLEQDVRLASNEDNWLLFRTRQLNDNDRIWVERIERRGNQFTVLANQAERQGPDRKNFTRHVVIGVNLGQLETGTYKATWIINPLVFDRFERPARREDNWPGDERPRQKQPTALPIKFTVVPAAR